MAGTCDWVKSKAWYSNWTTSEEAIDHPIIWIAGKPATGKSTLSSFLVDSLQEEGKSCSFHFFKHNDSNKSKLSFCLRALIFQMACQDHAVRRGLEELVINDIFLDIENARNVWRALFETSFVQDSPSTHYWVIDGLDECTNPRLFIEMLSRTKTLPKLRIVMTAVENTEIQQSIFSLQTSYCQQYLRPEDTQLDIEKLVVAKTRTFTFMKSDEIPALANIIIEKANGSFLWSRLVLDELSQCYSKNDVDQVLDGIPLGMMAMYRRALDIMAQAPRGKKLAEAILAWVSGVSRPLTVAELESALELDLEDKFHNLEEKLGSICGHLVVVNRSKRVEFVHETARRFLLDPELQSDFAIREKACHARIAKVCLTFMSSDSAKLPIAGRGSRAQTFKKSLTTCIASQYFCEEFSSHFIQAEDSAVALLPLMETFLQFNVLPWIERTAGEKSLSPMVQVGRNLKLFVDRYTGDLSPLRKDVRVIKCWAVDLQRIAAKFYTALLDSPSAISSVIAPFCPVESVIHNIRVPGRRLQVIGASNSQWDDRLTCVDFREGMATALAYGEDFFAVGFIKGRIALYHSNSCQEYSILKATGTIDLLSFKAKSSLLAAATLKSIQVWDVRTGQILFYLKPEGKCLAITFSGSNLLVASVKNVLTTWELGDEAKQVAQAAWSVQHETQGPQLPKRQPSALSIGTSHGLLAVAHNNFPITLWDIEDNILYGTCGKKLPDGSTSTHPVTGLVFNPNPNIPLLAVSYLDGEVAIIDPISDDEIAKQRIECHTLAASPDGRFLAGAAGGGTIQIFEFDTLRLLYKVKSTAFYIQKLAFSFDGAQLSDLRGSQCNVWRPPILVGESIDDDASIDTCTTLVETSTSANRIPISSMEILPDGYIICGKVNGAVDLYNSANAAFLHQLYTEHSTIQYLKWMPQKQDLLSIGLANTINITTLQLLPKVGWRKKSRRLQSRLEAQSTISQVVIADNGRKFILSTEFSDHFWDADDGEESRRDYSDQSKSRLWCEHPASRAHVLMFDGTTAKVFSWADWTEVYSVNQSLNTVGLFSCHKLPSGLSDILLEIRDADRAGKVSDVLMLRSTASPQDSSAIDNFEMVSLNFERLFDNMRFVIGVVSPKTMLFLDGHSWVCSIDLSAAMEPLSSYCRHFFIPYDWFAGMRLPVVMPRGGDIIFVKHDEVVIVKGTLGRTEVVTIAL